jgi:hypothetical protein
MVMTRNNGPDRNIQQGPGVGPQWTGSYGQIGSPDSSMDTASDQAANIYSDDGDQGNPRLDRITGIADVADSDTNNGEINSYGPGFIQGQGFTSTPSAAQRDGLLSGLPSSAYLGGDTDAPSQGRVLSNPTTTKSAPTVSNSGSPQQTGRYGV